MENAKCILKINNISKTFPGVKALQNISLDLNEGEVLAICGENGAGKSTLMKVIAAIHQPDNGGEIIYRGEKVHFKTPLDAKKAGIVLVFQELSLVKQLSVAENIYLGSLPRTSGKTIHWKKLYNDSKEVLDLLDCDINPKVIIDDLTIAHQQMVEIARAIALGARVLILDEPTSSLTEKEKVSLFNCINRLKKQGVGIIYITHKMDEVFQISDRISVFRDGCNTSTLVTKKASLQDVIQLMIGRTLENYYIKSAAKSGEEVLKVENISVNGLFEDISFSLHKGEVLGFYGLVGAGRTEIVETLFGLRKHYKGNIYVDGKHVSIRNTTDAVKMGIALCPENRKDYGLVLRMNCKDNLCLAKLKSLRKNGFIKDSRLTQLFATYKNMLSIATPSSEQLVFRLSGGNQQKIVIGKWLSVEPKILILDEPTRGIDIGAKAEIYKLIAEQSEKGVGIIVISSEMPEIMGICHRIIAIAQGRQTGELSESDISEKNLIEAITI